MLGFKSRLGNSGRLMGCNQGLLVGALSCRINHPPFIEAGRVGEGQQRGDGKAGGGLQHDPYRH